MADDKNIETDGQSVKKKKGKLPLIIILVVVLLVLGGGGFAVYKFVLAPSPDSQQVEEVPMTMDGTPAPQNARAEPGPMQAYDPFLVNLADPGGERYLSVTLSIELSKDKNFPAEVTSKEPKIKDIIISVLSSKTYEEISTAQGKIALKQEILRRLNTIMSGGRILDVYITQFVIQ